MSAQHTPGPWIATKDSRYNDVARIGRAWIIGSELALSHFGHPDADARLIAAAPELLAALQDARVLLQHSGCPLDWLDAVVAKATGAAS